MTGPTLRSAVVFGADGMGLATAQRIASGYRIVLVDDDPGVLAAGRALLTSQGHAVEGHLLDATDRSSIQHLATSTALCGPIDAIVYAATVSPVTASARRIYAVDLVGAARVIDAFLPVARVGTALVCISSMAGHALALSESLERHLALAPTDDLLDHPEIDVDAPDGALAYAIAKRGTQLRVQASASRWGRAGARVNTLSPGVTATPVGQAELDGPVGPHIRQMVDESGSRRIGTPQDIAAAAAFLLSAEASYITGTDLLIDGGALSAHRWKVPA
ncbi:MAG TPA: SDR family oxidoreductase [Mycobacteriales bacterium]|nr:SDR family oxidoreductase [Mycobacteriales bacterium]